MEKEDVSSGCTMTEGKEKGKLHRGAEWEKGKMRHQEYTKRGW